ncbi:MAG: ABC transporter ATP-binding protein [Myxococcota bacterium]
MSLKFENISHAYGDVLVLSELDLDVKAGEITCLLGPSGGGKSTLLRLAAGLEILQAGRIEIDGQVYSSPDETVVPERRPIGMMFQDNALFPHMTVGENVAFGLARWPAAKRRTRVESLLHLVGCDALATRYPHQLSGGQQQRVALVRSLAPEPRVLLMDEPYASVDISLRRTLREAARQTLKRDGTTALLVTHDPSEAMEMADTIVVLDAKRILQRGPPQDLYERPAAATVAGLFGDAQRLRARRTDRGFETDFGVIAGDEGKAGECELVIRPDGLALTKDDNASAVITDLRFVGESWLAFLRPRASEGPVEPLRVTIRRADAWQVEDPVSLSRAGKGFFVFDSKGEVP